MAIRRREAEYKPLLYTTTIRNPERYKDFMCLLYKFNGQVLTNELIGEIEREFFKVGLYRPMRLPQSAKEKLKSTKTGEFSDIALSDQETLDILNMNDPLINPEIKGHKEAGFDRGWPSRFQTQFSLMKTLGFVHYNIGEEIKFSETGYYLAHSVNIKVKGDIISREIIHPEYEQMAFLQSFCKQQRCNPFIRELNDNIPLILLLKVIRRINNNTLYGNCGISYKELPLLIFWKDNNDEALYNRIVQLRKDYGYNVPDEIIEEICVDEILGGFKSFKLKSIVSEYPDEFVRKMRMTGLISFRGGGRFIDINHNEDEKIDYILKTYSQYKKHNNEIEYFNYMSSIDKKLFSIETTKVTPKQTETLLKKWVDYYSWDTIKTELCNLAERKSSKDNILKFLAAPVRLEFLTALAIKSKLSEVKVIPNYTCDDEGLPTSTAGGKIGDIECFEHSNGILVEVTMAEGRTQTSMEVWPIERHLEAFKEKHTENSQCIFIAPTIFHDTMRQIKFVKMDTGNIIRPYPINDFIEFLDQAIYLYQKK